MRNLGAFLRSLLPTDPKQVIFLAGVVLVFVSSRLPWWPSQLLQSPDFIGSSMPPSPLVLALSRPLVVVCGLVVMSAGLAGYFLCFWPVKRLLLRLLCSVFVPSLASLSLVLGVTFLGLKQGTSVLYRRGAFADAPSWFYLNLLKFPSGPLICGSGLVLILMFATLLVRGKSSLPLALAVDDSGAGTDPEVWPRVRLANFVLVGPWFLFSGLLAALIVVPYTFSHSLSVGSAVRLSNFVGVLGAALLVCAVVAILGGLERSLLRSSLRLPRLTSLLIGATIPIAVSWLVPFSQYVIARVDWAAHHFGRTSPPQISSYFNFENTWREFLIVAIVASVAEEMVFRGMLLPKFIERYGMFRGIFFTGLSWAALHFHTDNYSGRSPLGVMLCLAERILLCLALNYVLVWLTLRYRSILPGAVLHCVWNLLATVSNQFAVAWELELEIVLLAVLAYALYRYWPVSVNPSSNEFGPAPLAAQSAS